MAIRTRSDVSTNCRSQGQTEAALSQHCAGSRRRIQLALPPLGICLLLYVFLLSFSGNFQNGPRTRALGGDFALNITGAVILQAGGNPYDHRQTIATQQSFFARQGIETPLDNLTRSITWGAIRRSFFGCSSP